MTAIHRVMGNAHEVAMGLAHRHKLIDDEGWVWCWVCNQELALMPSLHCHRCLAAAYHRLGIIQPHCMQHEQEEPCQSSEQDGSTKRRHG